MHDHRLEALLDLVTTSAEATSTASAAMAFTERIQDVCDVDYAVYCEHAIRDDQPMRVTVTSSFTPIEGTWEILCAYSQVDPWLSHVRRTGDLRAARWDDFASSDELARNPIVRELYKPAGTDHVLHAPICWGTKSNVMMTLSRQGHMGFTDEERRRIEILGRSLGKLFNLPRRIQQVSSDSATIISPSSATNSGAEFERVRQILTVRQQQIVALITQGFTNRQIALQLGMSPRTVQKHIEHIFARLGIKSRTSAATLWSQAQDEWH